MGKNNGELSLNEMVDKYPDVSRFIILKLYVQRRGLTITENALNAVQQEPLYNFGQTWRTFGRDNEEFVPGKSGYVNYLKKTDNEVSRKFVPGSLSFRDGTSTYMFSGFGVELDNPYTVDYVDGKFFIYDNGKQIEEVDFATRPDYYGKKTSRGIPMESIAHAACSQRLRIDYYRHCHYWNTGDQCHYCSIFTDLKEQRLLADAGKIPTVIDPEDIYETVKEVLKEPGRFSLIHLVAGADYSGNPPFENEVNRHIKVLQAIGRNFKARKFPSSLAACAYTKKQLKRIYDETGLSSYNPNIEVWDEKLFKWICPGKAKWFGRDYWIRAALDAVEIFGKGNVQTNFVAGVEMAQPYGFKTVDEALKSNFEACEFYAKHGVIYMSTCFRPGANSKLAGQKQPPLEYHVRLAKGLRDIRKSYGLAGEDHHDYKRCGAHPDTDLDRID